MPISTIVAFPGPPALEHLPFLLYPFEFPRPFEVFEGGPFSTEASSETPSNVFVWQRPKVFEAFEGLGRFGQTQAQGDRMDTWGHLCAFGPTKTFVNTHWRAFWGVFYRLENKKTLVTGEWNAMYLSCFWGECNISGDGGCPDCTPHAK